MRAPVITLPSRIAAALQVEEPPDTSPAADIERPVAPPVGEGRFEALLITEGQWTDDGRFPELDSVEWRSPPLALEFAPKSQGGHDEIVVGGAITSIRKEGEQVLAEGVFSADELGQELRQLVRDGMLTWISIVPVTWESTVYVPTGEEGEPPLPIPGEEDEGALEVPFDSRLPLERVHRLVIGSATVLSQPAQGTTWIREIDETAAEPLPEETRTRPEETGIAAAATPKPSAGWFVDPELNGPTPLTVTDNGRVFGHIAQWGVCHRGHLDACVLAPRSTTNYAEFLTGGYVETDEGQLVRVGHLTMDALHAELSEGIRETRRHYEDSATVWANVVVGEDVHGIWCAGACVPGLDEDRMARARALALSGDWRRLSGVGMEMIAALSVPVPGFPVAVAAAAWAESRVKAHLKNGEVDALVAAGIILPDEYAETQREFGPVERALLPLAVGELDRRVLKAIDRKVNQ